MNYESSEYRITLPSFKSSLLYTPDCFEEQEYFDSQREHGSPLCLMVSAKSPLSVRKCCETLGKYFRREFRYDFRPYVVNYAVYDPHWLKHRLYLWYIHDTFEKKCFGVGALGVNWYDFKDGPSGWELGWVWLHPYFRGQGYLSSIWDFLLQRFPKMWVLHPLSPAMEAFLKLKGYDVVMKKMLQERRDSSAENGKVTGVEHSCGTK